MSLKALCGISLVLLLMILSGSNIKKSLVDDVYNNKVLQTENYVEARNVEIQELPKPLMPVILETLGRDNSKYHIKKTKSGSFMANNPSQKFETTFTKGGINVSTHNPDIGSLDWRIKLIGIGYGKNITPVFTADPIASANRIEYPHGKVTEWYINSPFGLEQGFTIDAPLPHGQKGTKLVLEFKISEGLLPMLKENRKAIDWKTEKGQRVFTYGGLYAFDSKGKELSSSMTISRGKLSIFVDDTGAKYPITIDPTIFTEDAKLLASDAAAGDGFGSVSIYGDYVVVGVPDHDCTPGLNCGSAYVYVKPSLGWLGNLIENAKLTASDAAAGDRYGESVSVSGDTVVVGAPFDDCTDGIECGSAYVFVKPLLGWSGNLTEDAKLTASDAAANDDFSRSVSISGDTVVVGAPFDDCTPGLNCGSAYVYVKPSLGWLGNLIENAKLTASDAAAGDRYGESVSISDDTAVVGNILDDCTAGSGCGSAYVFVKPLLGWSGSLTEDAKLTASDAAEDDLLGISVSISDDTVVVGAHLDDCTAGSGCGSAYVFVKPSGGWSGNLTEDAKLTASDAAAVDVFGKSVSISWDTVVVGAPEDDCTAGSLCGSAYVFVKPSGGWSGSLTEDAKLIASDAASPAWFGASVSISGYTLVVGAHLGNPACHNCGSAYLYQLSFEPPIEGPPGDPTCSDGDDNDDDGDVDLDDPECVAPFLSFPLYNKTPYDAVINTVFDHSMDQQYCPDEVVTAYNGEEGRSEFGISDFSVSFRDCDGDGTNEPLLGFENEAGTPFDIGGQYSGGGEPNFLFYEGHPGYDYRTKDQLKDGSLCPGETLCSKKGRTPVLAAASGVVTCAKKNGCPEGPGEVKIDHGNGYSTIYLHLSKIKVKVNDGVSKGQEIGLSGDKGSKSNPHLHFELRKIIDGILVPVDPYGWEGAGADPYTRAFNVNLWE